MPHGVEAVMLHAGASVLAANAAWAGQDNFVIIVLLFFFQAEDGLRDLIVTGVQSVLFRSLNLPKLIYQIKLEKPFLLCAIHQHHELRS